MLNNYRIFSSRFCQSHFECLNKNENGAGLEARPVRPWIARRKKSYGVDRSNARTINTAIAPRVTGASGQYLSGFVRQPEVMPAL